MKGRRAKKGEERKPFLQGGCRRQLDGLKGALVGRVLLAESGKGGDALK